MQGTNRYADLVSSGKTRRWMKESKLRLLATSSVFSSQSLSLAEDFNRAVLLVPELFRYLEPIEFYLLH